MKKYLFVLLSMLPLVGVAQYYNPYDLYQQQQQANQNAYNWGYGMGLYYQGVTALCEERFSDAFDLFYEGVDYNAMNYEGVGVCYELGFGVSVNHEEARRAYETGASYGNMACKTAIQRIRQSGYWSKSFKSTFLNNLRIAQSANNSIPNNGYVGGGNFGGSSGGSGSSDYTCPTCHGSTRCTMCAGRGEWRDSDGRLHECSMCQGRGTCYGCHGRGTIR